MKKKLPTIVLLSVFILGLAILLYPTISNWWNGRHSSRAIASYDESLIFFEEEDFTEYWEAAERYNEMIAARGRFTPVDDEELAAYLDTLDPAGTGMLGYIEIDKIDVRLPIYHTVDDTVLQVAVGHLPESSLPTGGKGNHIAISGHRGLPSAVLFTDLDRLEEGDLFVLTVMDRILTYEVDQIRIVNPEEVEDLAIDPEQDYCTLITCTPYGVNTQRMLVRGVRTDNVAGITRRVIASDATQMDTLFVSIGIAVPILIILVIILFVTTSKKRSNDDEHTGTDNLS